MNFGAALTGLGQGFPQGLKDSQNITQQYEAGLDQQATAAAGQGLQLLHALSMQPPTPTLQQGMQPPPGMQPQGGGQPPMGGMPQPSQLQTMGGPPPMPQGSPPMGAPPGGGMAGGPTLQPMQRGPMGQPGQPQPQMQPPQQPQGQPQQQGFGQQGGQQGGGLDWRTLIMAIQRGNPGAPPQVLMAAVNKLVPLMNSQSMLEWRQMQAQLGQQRIGVQEEGIKTRAATAAAGQENQANIAAGHDATRKETTGENIESREKIAKGKDETTRRGQDIHAETAKARQASIDAHRKITEDQGWQRLDQQRKALEARIKQGGDRQAITQWRTILDAQHKKATEIINSYSINNNMPKAERDRLLKESNDAYEKAIKEIGGGDKPPSFSDRFTGGGQSSP